MDTGEKHISKYYNRYDEWKLWQLYAPPGVMLIVWVFAGMFRDTMGTFIMLCTNGGLILYASYVFVSLLLQLRQIQMENPLLLNNRIFSKIFGLTLFCSLLGFLGYGIIQADMLKGAYFCDENFSSILYWYVVLNLAGAFASSMISNYLYLRVIKELSE